MIGTRQEEGSIVGIDDQRSRDARRALIEAYGLPLGERLELERRYALVGVADAEYAFSDYSAYTRAMSALWSAGLVPEPRPSTVGADLPGVVPHLREVDPDLADITAADVRRPRRFR